MTKKRKNEKERARSIKACEALEFQTRPSSSDYLHTAKKIFEIHPRVLEIFCGQTYTHTHTTPCLPGAESPTFRHFPPIWSKVNKQGHT